MFLNPRDKYQGKGNVEHQSFEGGMHNGLEINPTEIDTLIGEKFIYGNQYAAPETHGRIEVYIPCFEIRPTKIKAISQLYHFCQQQQNAANNET